MIDLTWMMLREVDCVEIIFNWFNLLCDDVMMLSKRIKKGITSSYSHSAGMKWQKALINETSFFRLALKLDLIVGRGWMIIYGKMKIKESFGFSLSSLY